MRIENKEPIIIHIDMDAFFASVEQRSNPRLAGKPIIVCGSPKSRSVVTSASYQAREFGIKAGMPTPKAKLLCPQAIFVSADHDKYIDTAERLFSVFKEFTPYVEIFSIDEAFLDATGIIHMYKSPQDLALKIKQRVNKELGLSCSIGIGPNKLLAKFASEIKKPDGLFIIEKDKINELLKEAPVDKLCGIGEKTKNRLLFLGIKTCDELAGAPSDLLLKEFGILGPVLKEMGRGSYSSPVCPYYDEAEAKSMGNSLTLSANTYDKSKIRSTILFLSEKVARRLREGRYQGETVSLTLRLSDFFTKSKSMTIQYRTDDGATIYATAIKLLDAFNIAHKSVRMLGVSVSNLSRNQDQRLLFDYRLRKRLNKAIDKINDKFGECAIHKAAAQAA